MTETPKPLETGRSWELWKRLAQGRKEFGITEAARAHTPEAVERLVHWMRSDHPTASVAACNALLDRGHGKAPAMIKPANEYRAPLEMTDEQIRERLAALRGILLQHGIDPLGLPSPNGAGGHR